MHLSVAAHFKHARISSTPLLSMALTTPTAFSSMAVCNCRQANVGPDLLAYLKARSLDRTATLALVANDEAKYVKAIVEPRINGVTVEVPIAKATMLDLWSEARRQRNAHVALPCQHSRPMRSPPCRYFSAWSACVEAYNAKLLDGKRCSFPTQQLLGAEEILARLYREHHKTNVYTLLGLGEILSRRT